MSSTSKNIRKYRIVQATNYSQYMNNLNDID